MGLLPETSGEPILLRSVRSQTTLSTDRLEDLYGDLYAEAWGNRVLEYQVALDQLAQYGLSDAYLGRFDATLLANLALVNGIDPNSGVALLTQAGRETAPGRLAAVQLTIRVEDTRNAGQGSPDGPSTPSWGSTPGGTRPAITSSTTLTATIGTAFSHTITATGTATITYSLAPGQTLPASLSLSGAVISGTPTGEGSVNYLEIRATNAYGSTSKIVKLTVSEPAAAPPEMVQVYVRYLYDSASATIPDAFWAVGYWGMDGLPASELEFYNDESTDSEAPAGAPAFPVDPEARTGTLAGRDWEITEILAWDGTEYVYLYQRTAADTALADSVARGGDVLGNASGFSADDDIGTDGPGGEPDPSWPGTIVPSSRIEQYFIYKNFGTGESICGGLGGDKKVVDVAAFLKRYPNISLNWTETRQLVLMEIYNNFGTPAYLYQRSVDDTAIEDTLPLLSPVWHAATLKGTVSTSLTETVPDFTLVSLPTSPGWTGPAPDSTAWCYVLERQWDGGGYRCYGLYRNAPTTMNLTHFLRVQRAYLSRADHDEMSAGNPWIEEIWCKIGADPWKAYWLKSGLTASTSKIGQALASNVSPVNHPNVAPGELYAIPLINGQTVFDP
ncbi:MAG: hypothetical protein E6R03_06690 [Hyphomicrobiaceae bacterium]|nr:MAG: hypothetical protein E6R03_06690 [Hyphomicrobiaceae bacterium]